MKLSSKILLSLPSKRYSVKCTHVFANLVDTHTGQIIMSCVNSQYELERCGIEHQAKELNREFDYYTQLLISYSGY